MANAGHVAALQKLCRLCGRAIQRRSIPKTRLANLISQALAITVADDQDGIHPPSICELCDRKLARWNLKSKKRVGIGQGNQVDIPVEAFKEHDDDCFCLHDEGSSEPDLFLACKNKAQEFGMLSEMRSSKILLLSLDNEGNTNKCLSIEQDGQWGVRVYGQQIELAKTHMNLPGTATIETLPEIVKSLMECHVCPGNSDFVVPDSVLANKPAYIHHLPNTCTVRHKGCPLLTTDSKRCPPCRIYRSTLSLMHHRQKIVQSPAAKTNYRYVKPVKLAKKLGASKALTYRLERRVDVLEGRIKKLFDAEAGEVTQKENRAFRNIFNKATEEELKFPEKSPERLLWNEQKKNMARNPNGRRWHPAILRLCIALCAKSSAAYDLLRSSGFLLLPNARTLKHYTNYTSHEPGFNANILKRICQDIKLPSLKQHERNITLAFDEMKISQGLVYSHASGEIIGFTDLGDFNNELNLFKRTCDKGKEPAMASHVLVLMARAISASYRVPVAYFATLGATADQLYNIILEAVEYLHFAGFNVRAIVSDGAAANRSLYKILQPADEPFFVNPFTGSHLYLFCDVPHLIKTSRNNLENSGFNQNTRNMKFRGLSVTWQHILNVYEWDLGNTSSLRMLHRLTEEPVRLTPAHRMKVYLAAQVLSSTMANALKVQGDPLTESTRTVIEYMDMFFDCLNGSTVNVGARKRKPALQPYKSVDDWRFTWLQEDFLSFLDEWESEGMLVEGLTAVEREKLHFSRQTMLGLRMTVNSFVSLTKELLSEGVDYILSEKFTQDPLEEYFSKQRGMGGGHDNPSVHQFGSNMLTLQVAGTCISASKRANVSSTSGPSFMDDTPIPRKRVSKKKD